MKQKELKQELIKHFNTWGFLEFQKRDGYDDVYYACTKIGDFKVYIYLSNQVRVFIETSGTKNYYILLKETKYKFEEDVIGLSHKAVAQYLKYKEACESFELLT